MAVLSVCTSCGAVAMVATMPEKCAICTGPLKSHDMVTAAEWAHLDEIDAVYEYDGTRLCDVDPCEAPKGYVAALPLSRKHACDDCDFLRYDCDDHPCAGDDRMDMCDVIFLRKEGEG